MSTEKRVKAQARALLSDGNWSSALGVFFILFVGVLLVLFIQSVLVLGVEVIVTPVFNSLEELSEVFSLEDEESIGTNIMLLIQNGGALISYALGFLFLFPLYCGVKRYFYLLTKGEKPGIVEVFYYLSKKLKKCIVFGLRYGLLCVVKMLPCIAPAVIITSVMMSFELSTWVNSLLTLAIFVTGIAGLALWILWTSRQFLSIYLFIENDNLPAGTYAKESVRIVNNALNSSVRKLKFSFTGWLLLALTGVGMLYFVPYFEAAAATSAKWIIKLDKEVY